MCVGNVWQMNIVGSLKWGQVQKPFLAQMRVQKLLPPELGHFFIFSLVFNSFLLYDRSSLDIIRT